MNVYVSVVIPTYKRPRLLDRCLGALLAQRFPPSAYEVIVADDAGDSGTWRVVARRRRAAAGRVRLRYVTVSGRHGPAAARNCGWRTARGRIIAFTDDDCVPAPDWLREGLRALGAGRAAVWGRVAVPLPAQPTDYERDAARLGSAGFVTANCFCRRQVLEEIGGLDESFTAPWREDSDLYFSLLERDHEVAQAPRALVTHPVRPARWGESLWRQRRILFDALLYKKHPALYRATIRGSPRWDYYAVLALLLLAIAGAAYDSTALMVAAGLGWSGATGWFAYQRLRRTSWHPGHVVEVLFTSALIPPLAVFWRLVGAVKYRVVFL